MLITSVRGVMLRVTGARRDLETARLDAAGAGGAAERGDEDRVPSARGGREELHDLAIVERETGGAEPQRVGDEVRAPAVEAGFEVDQPVAAVTVGRQHVVERRREVDDRGRIGAQRL